MIVAERVHKPAPVGIGAGEMQPVQKRVTVDGPSAAVHGAENNQVRAQLFVAHDQLLVVHVETGHETEFHSMPVDHHRFFSADYAFAGFSRGQKYLVVAAADFTLFVNEQRTVEIAFFGLYQQRQYDAYAMFSGGLIKRPHFGRVFIERIIFGLDPAGSGRCVAAKTVYDFRKAYQLCVLLNGKLKQPERVLELHFKTGLIGHRKRYCGNCA